jgi:hypothetical protein
VNGDGFVTTNDALQVINFLNAQGNGEAEFAMAFAAAIAANEQSDDSEFDQLLSSIAVDRMQSFRRRRG